MKKSGFVQRLLAISTLMLMSHTVLAADALLLQAKKLVDGGKASEAYALLAPLQSTRAGEVEYDYLLGVAALNSGRPAEAVFALERVLSVKPDNGPARLEMARAHYVMGDKKTAREEFETVKQQHPPQQVNQAIQKYLGAINQLEDEERTKWRGYVELGAGRDTNANSATSTSQIAIPFFGGAVATLAPGSMSTSDNFLSATAGLSVRHAISPEWIFNSSASIAQRKYSQASAYDLGNIDGMAGLTRVQGVDQFTGALQYQKIFVDRTSYRNTFGMLGQWQHSIDDASQFSAYGQIMRLSYDGTQQIRDANRYVLGSAYSQGFSAQFLPVIYIGAYLGKELPRDASVSHLGNDFIGLRLGGQLMLSPSMTLVGSTSYEGRRYRGTDAVFLTTRSDQQTDFSLSLNYTPLAMWTIRPEISYTRNRSNIILNDYSRTQYSIAVRHEF